MATLNADISAPSLVSLVPRQQEELQVQGDNRMEVWLYQTSPTICFGIYSIIFKQFLIRFSLLFWLSNQFIFLLRLNQVSCRFA